MERLFGTALFLEKLLLHTSSEVLLFLKELPFSEQLPLSNSYFFKNNYFFREKLLPRPRQLGTVKVWEFFLVYLIFLKVAS